jgi:hypothetical protein
VPKAITDLERVLKISSDPALRKNAADQLDKARKE